MRISRENVYFAAGTLAVIYFLYLFIGWMIPKPVEITVQQRQWVYKIDIQEWDSHQDSYSCNGHWTGDKDNRRYTTDTCYRTVYDWEYRTTIQADGSGLNFHWPEMRQLPCQDVPQLGCQRYANQRQEYNIHMVNGEWCGITELDYHRIEMNHIYIVKRSPIGWQCMGLTSHG